MRTLWQLPFREMPLADVRALCREWVAIEDERIATLGRLSGRAVRPTRAGLVETWTWFVQWHDAGGWEEPVDGAPLWAGPHDLGLPAAALVAVDGLLAQLAKAAYAQIPGARWTVFHSRRTNDIMHHVPVLWHPEHDYHLDAIGRTGVMMRGVGEAGLSFGRLPDRLANLHDEFGGDYHAMQRSAEALRAGRTRMIVPGEPVPPVPPVPPGEPVPPVQVPVSAASHGEHDWRTGADLVAFMDSGGALYELEDERDVQIGFVDEVAHLASPVIDALVCDLDAARIAGVARIYREDREVITVEAAGRRQIDLAHLQRVVAERVRARLTDFGSLQRD